MDNIVVFGGSGTIGKALVQKLSSEYPSAFLHVFSRREIPYFLPKITCYELDFLNEEELSLKANMIKEPVDLVIVATGKLHDKDLMPEKSLKDLSYEKLVELYAVNTIGPTLVAKHFLPKLNRKSRSVFAAISARVGSIGDNRLGGWYAYRMSKTALNMFIKTASIEIKRTNKNAVIIGLHPGTVDSDLSKPFQANVPKGKLFPSDYSAEKMISVIKEITPDKSGQILAWDGQIIPD
ncbi:SDR family NAD(P)-dependent oxidoreductase [Kiloniella majae]|uniref:SDR family NAD(P)-dependent oxidoreductase n=1 Tax=Kiloniella majae TaxID=1938558 RepID=UPI000A27957C|nr:SDR family NAD(P)-dependent oxidoreductase [Kiloniella majae]